MDRAAGTPDKPCASDPKAATRLFARAALLPEGWMRDVAIEIVGDTIASVRSGAEPAGQIFDVFVPGIPNLHSHAFQRLMAGLTETRTAGSDSFWSWRDLMYDVVGVLDPDSLQDIYAYVFASMIEAGYTSVAEFHYVHNAPDGRHYDDDAEMSLRAVAAARTAGLAATHLPVVYCRAGLDDAPLGASQLRLACDLDRARRIASAVGTAFKDWDDLNVGLAPHSLRAVSPSLLHRIAESAREIGPASVVHIHVAEQVREVEECLSVHGVGPIGLLLRSVPVDSSWCLIHCTQATPQDFRAIGATGATVALCPVTEANLGDGIVDLPALVAGASAFGVGSDSQATLSPWQEFRSLEYAQRLAQRQRNVAADEGRSVGRFLVETSTAAGEAALGRRTGRLAPGYKADIVELRRDADASLASLEGDQFLDAWIFAADRARPSSVFVSGRRLVTDGVHRDAVDLERRYLSAVGRLRARL